MDFIGCCEVDPEVPAELETAFPHVPNHGDMRTAIATMEAGELALQPDILIFTAPCQSRSRARLLTEWYNKEHPHHHLWDLQAKFIALAKPKMILIENVPPRSWGDRPTQSMYDELAKKIRDLGYSYTHKEELNCAEYGGNTSRRRYFGVGIKGDVPYTFPAPRTTYSGFRGLLDPANSVRHTYQRRLSSTESWSPVRLSAPNSSPFRSKQIGRMHPETEQEQDLANRLGMQTPKGFRVHSSKHPAPTICSYGAEKYCGPGRHTQFITDKAGIRVVRIKDAARVTGCLPRVVEQLSTIKESLAMRMAGNMAPVEPIGAILGEMAEQYEQLGLHTPVTGSLHPAATQLIKKAKEKEPTEQRRLPHHGTPLMQV
jgi:site-specific DNA-cytosine methylase